MKVKIEKGGPCRKTLVVELPVEDVEAEYKKTLAVYTGIARIPGFRKGHAPANLVESHLAREIWEEVKDRLIGRSYPEALKQAQLKPVMILDLKAEAAPKKPLVYRVVLDIPPEFKLPKYKGIAIAKKPVEVSDEDLQKAFNRFMERMATTEVVTDHPARKGDLVQVDYTRKDMEGVPKASGGKQSDPLASGRDFWLAIGEADTFLPGFADALEGLAVGDQKDVTLQMPPDFRMPELAGKQVVYDVKLKAVRGRKMPVMNDEFFKSIGVQSETELRDKMKATLLEEAQRMEKERQKGEIIDYLLKRADVDLPESIVQEETRHLYVSIMKEKLMRGSTREQLAAQKEELLTTATKTAGEKVKLGYILHKIGEEEKIAVEEAEVEREIQVMAQRYRMAPDELKKELGEKNELDALKHEIRMGKILDFLLANTGTEEPGIISRLFNKKEVTSATVAK